MTSYTQRLVSLLAALTILSSACKSPDTTQTPEPPHPTEPPQTEPLYSFQPPTGFEDLPTSPGPLCPERNQSARHLELVNASLTQSGQLLIVFETGIPFISSGEFQTVVRSGDQEYTFNCGQVADTNNRLYCSGPRLAEKARTEFSIQVESQGNDVFNLGTTAPGLVAEFNLPEGDSLETIWAQFFNCRENPSAPECKTIEGFFFPPLEQAPNPFDDEPDSGLILLWSIDSLITDPTQFHYYPYTPDLEAIAGDYEGNCVIGLRSLANQCAPWAFQPMEVNEIVAIEDIMFLVEYMWENHTREYTLLFVDGDMSYATGEMYYPPLDPENWTYEELASAPFRYVPSDYRNDENFAACMEFMIASKACYEELDIPLTPPPELPNCATEEAVERVNQCIEDSDISGAGFIDPIEVGDNEAWMNALAFLEGWPTINGIDFWIDTYWELVLFDADTPTEEEYLLDIYFNCITIEDMECIEDYLSIQQYLTTSMMLGSSLPPECDPEIPDSLWCQGTDDQDDPGEQMVAACGEEIGWTAPLDTNIDRAQLLRAVSLGLPWVNDLNMFPNCRKLYTYADMTFTASTGLPLQSLFVCDSTQGDTTLQTFNANFLVPYVADNTSHKPGGNNSCNKPSPPDSSPCWIWNQAKCKWECYN